MVTAEREHQEGCSDAENSPSSSGSARHRAQNITAHAGCRAWQSVALCSLLTAVLLPAASAVTPLTAWQSGIATNYGGPADGKNPYDNSWGTLDGSCGYGKLDKGQWPYWSVAALSSSNSFVQAGPLNGCGMCFEVKCVDVAPFAGRCAKGNQVSTIVQITDICPECGADHLDIQALTYNKLSPMDTGRISIMYRRVECVPPKPMVIFVDNNGGAGNWLRLFVEQAGGAAAVKQVQVRSSNSQGGFQNLNNKWGSDWEMPVAPSFPLDINIVGVDGESVTAYQVIQSAGATGKMATTVQFKIADPGDQALTAAVNGDGSSTPSAGARGDSVTSPSLGSSPSRSGGASGCTSCTDTPPSSVFTCQQQKDFNACSQSWMTSGSYCAQTCGRCTCGGSSSGSSPSGGSGNSPSPSSSWSPSPGASPSPSPSWSPSPSPNWSPSYSPASWSPSPNWSPSPGGSYASGGRKLLAPALAAAEEELESADA